MMTRLDLTYRGHLLRFVSFVHFRFGRRYFPHSKTHFLVVENPSSIMLSPLIFLEIESDLT